MPRPPTSINNLAADTLAHIFALLPPNERVRLERVCRHWCKVAKTLAWHRFRTLRMDKYEMVGLAQRGDMGVAKYRALIDRCGSHLRELSFDGLTQWEFNAEQWAKMRNLRHLRFDSCVSSDMLRAVADKLTHLQSIHFYYIDGHSAAELRDLLRNNTSLQALRLPLYNSFHPLTLPCSIRLLHISSDSSRDDENNECDCIGEMLEVVTSSCPQLAMLILPKYSDLSELSLAKLAQFKKIFYLRLCFKLSQTILFGNLLVKIGALLRVLLLQRADSKVLQLIARYCPLLEHCSFCIFYRSSSEAEELSYALRSVFQLAHLRSVSIPYDYSDYRLLLRTQMLDAISRLIAKGNLEYIHLFYGLPLSVEFITSLIQLNPKLRKLACATQDDHTPEELDKLKTLLQNMDGPMELELFEHCPPELEMGENSRVRVRASYSPLEDISQPMLREFWAQAMDSVPDLGNLGD